MASFIEEKIVKLSMESKDFTEKAKAAAETLSEFDKGWNKLGKNNVNHLTAGINSMQGALGGASGQLSRLDEIANTVTRSFSAMNIAAMTVVATITYKLTNAMLRVSKAMYLDGAIAGFRQYEDSLTQIQTILANSTGETTKSVQTQLDALRAYANQAMSVLIGYKDMTKGVSDFVSAGAQLKDSRLMTQGLSNLSAATGAQRGQTINAMYQLSQAYASGTVRAQDWISVVNSGMGGGLFQRELKETAKSMGIVVKETGSFKDSLQDGWLTAEVLEKTLKRMATDPALQKVGSGLKSFSALFEALNMTIASGWSDTWKLIIGDLDEAPKIIAPVADALYKPIIASRDARNKLIKDFIELGGKKDIIQAVANAFKAMITTFGAVKKGFREVFPKTTAKTLKEMSTAFVEFTKGLKPSKEALKDITDATKGFFSVIKLVINVIKGAFGLFARLIPDNLIDNLIKMAGAFGRLLQRITGINKKGKESIGLYESLGATFDMIGEVLGAGLTIAVELLTKGLDALGTAAEWVGARFKEIKEIFTGVFSSITLGQITLGAILIKFAAWAKSADKIKDVAGIVENFKGILGELKDAVGAFTDGIKANTLKQIAISIGILAASLFLLSTIDPKAMAVGITGLAASMLILIKTFELALGILSKDKVGVIYIAKTVGIIMSLAVALGILAASLKLLSTIPADRLILSIGALASIMAGLVITVSAMAGIEGKVRVSAKLLRSLATSILILSVAIKLLSTIPIDRLIVSVGALAVTMGVLVVTVTGLSVIEKQVIKASGLLISLGIALNLFAASMTIISNIDPERLQGSLHAIGALLAMVGIFVAAMTGIANIGDNQAQLIRVGIGITIVAVALNIMAVALKKFEKVKPDDIAKGLIALGVALAGIVAAMHLAKGGIGGAAAIAVVAVALNAIVPPILILGKTPLEQIAVGVGAIVVTLLAMAVAAKLIGADGALGLLAMSAALTAFAVAVSAVTVAIRLIVGLFFQLANSTATTVANIGSNFRLFIEELTRSVPVIINLVKELTVGVAKGIAETAHELALSGMEIAIGILEGIIIKMPEFLDVGSELVGSVMDGIARNDDDLIDKAVKLIVSLLEAMAYAIIENQDKIINAFKLVIGAVISLLLGLIGEVFSFVPGMKEEMAKTQTWIEEQFGIEKGKTTGSTYWDGFNEGMTMEQAKTEEEVEQVKTNIETKMNSLNLTEPGARSFDQFNKAIDEKRPETKKAVDDTRKTVENNVKPEVKKPVSDAMGGYSAAIKEHKASTKKAAEEIAKTVKYSSKPIGMNKVGSDAGQGIINGALSMLEGLRKAGEKMANALKSGTKGKKGLDERSPSHAMEEIAWYAGMGLIVGLNKVTGKVVATSTKLGSDMVTALYRVVSKNNYDKVVLSATDKLSKSLEISLNKRYKTYNKYIYKNGKATKKYTATYLAEYRKQKKKLTKLTIADKAKRTNKPKSQVTLTAKEKKQISKDAHYVANQNRKAWNNQIKAINNINKYISQANKNLKKQLSDITTELNKNIKEAIKNTTEAIRDSMNAFETWKPGKASGKNLLKWMQEQVDGLKKYQANIAEIRNRGVSEEFVGWLYNQGMGAAAEVEAISKMTEDQLKEYEALWKEKNQWAEAMAKDQANTKDSNLYDQIKDLKEQAEKAAKAAVEEWKKAMDNASTQIDKLKKDLKEKGVNLGSHTVKGMIKGLVNNQKTLNSKAKSISSDLIKVFEDALKIKSPSVIMQRIGEFITLGLGKGIEAKRKIAEMKSRKVSQNVVEAFKSTADKLRDAINDFSDPTITPVLNLENINPKKINDMIKRVKGMVPVPVGDGMVFESFTIDGIEINIQVPDGQSAAETVEEFKYKVQKVLQEEIRKLRRVRK